MDPTSSDLNESLHLLHCISERKYFIPKWRHYKPHPSEEMRIVFPIAKKKYSYMSYSQPQETKPPANN